ncbi:hypothetical protein TNCV_3296031 [Trichonephila clavipes]|uniref:Uncharacterized protein n=1 Tax=Trichonephila clavipes TaxID=2585209 RepID=A0A8X6SXQ4_TRICX|nr:hypothetical protein TNCV_3296031 [Trichonephila clavipes]
MGQLIAVTLDNPKQMRWILEVILDGIIKHTVVYTEELIHGTDSNQDDSNINLTWCDSMEGNSSTVNLGSLCNRIDIIFARPELTKKSRGKGDN